MDFVRGSVEVYDIIEQPDGKRMIAVLTQREKKGNLSTKIPKRITQGGRAKQQPPPQANVPVPLPAAPGMGPGQVARNRVSGPGMGLGARNSRSTETAVEYKDLASKDIDSAQLAETIWPQRMVIVTCTIPYRQQVEEYRRALRAAKAADLSDFPEYRGYVVERRVLGMDGKTVEQDWTELDVKGTLRDLYSRTIDFEPENPPNELPADLKALYSRLLPPEEFELLLPRPKLYRGEYPSANLKTVADALQSLLNKGEKAVELRTQTQNLIDDTNPFHRGGTGAGSGLQSGAPLPGGGKPNVPPGMRTLPPGMIPPGANAPAQQRPEDEDAWMMRFIDITCEAGHQYQYRVALKALNPNYQKPAKELAVPQLAEKEFLQSEFFEVPKTAVVPAEEQLYAASRDDRRKHDTEKMPAPGLWDESWLQMQRWYAAIRPDGFARAEPFGEWLVADLKVWRGQYVGEKLLLPLPIWSMENSMFLFRDNPARTRRGSSIRAETGRQTDPNWAIDLYPTPPVLLVDFEGGSGQYYGPRHSPVQDTVRGGSAAALGRRQAAGRPQRPGHPRLRPHQAGDRLDTMAGEGQRRHAGDQDG